MEVLSSSTNRFLLFLVGIIISIIVIIISNIVMSFHAKTEENNLQLLISSLSSLSLQLIFYSFIIIKMVIFSIVSISITMNANAAMNFTGHV